MKCPHCNAWTEVLRTKETVRRRECANGHRFWTEEVAKPELPDPWEDTKKAALVYHAQGMSVRKIALTLAVNRSTIYKWLRK
jgi:transposase-like protein